LINNSTVDLLSKLSLTLFRKNFFGIYHGSISAKVDYNSFIINTQDAIFDKITQKSLCEIFINKKDYRWNNASLEAEVHASIYNFIHEAKYIACGLPPYTTAYAFEHDIIEPLDFFGKTIYGKIEVYDPYDFETWYDRNVFEIIKYFKETNNHIMVIRGIGIYVFDRDINELVKKIAILENSCKLLSLKNSFN
jgi:L-fuculose-phosphate aldolase